MKHTWKITIVLLIMFLITQLIGLVVINFYSGNTLPYGMEPPEEKVSPAIGFSSIIFAFTIAVLLIFLLMRFKLKTILRTWFFVVVILAVALSLYVILAYFNAPKAAILAILLAIPFAFFKVIKQNIIIHNLSELLIYPGIAAVFVAILTQWGLMPGLIVVSLLLITISLYDIYAVWHAGFMQKMAKYQINHLNFFAGFFVPYAGKKEIKKIKLLKQKYKNKKIPNKEIKKKKIKVSLAILGGGDVVFPLITAGVLLRLVGLVPALFVVVFSTISLLLLFVLAKKGKFYPAMPFISAGCFVGMFLGLIV